MARGESKIIYLPFYIAFLVSSFGIVGFFFTTFIAPHLWDEWDYLPVVDFITPPSMHAGGGAFLLVDPIIAYLIWVFFLAITLLIPAWFTRLVMKERKNLIKKS